MSLTAPARTIRAELRRIERRMVGASDDTRDLLAELAAIYAEVLRRRGLTA